MLFSAPAGAACWEDVIEDWADNEQIDERYSDSCYAKALDKMPEDLRDYTNAADVIEDARQNEDRALFGRGGNGNDPGGGSGEGPNEGPIESVLSAGSDSVDSLPLPLLVMGIAALLLISAGAAGLVSRRLHARRAAPAAGEPPPDL